MSHSGHKAQNPVIVKDVNLILYGQRKTKSPRELYLSNKEETLIKILLVNHPSPQQGDSPHEQYLSVREEYIIVLYQLF